ncbi:MAG: biotin-dependent carboxyltransferase family protein [Saprospiraceae bacterium]
MTTFHFLKSGIQTLIQDQGRIGYQSYGVPISGVMDKKSAALANELVGNDLDVPVVEMALLGPTIKISGNCQIAITGANLSPKVNQQPIPLYETINLKDGDLLKFGGAKNGCRAYLAIRGNWQIKKWLNSYSALPYSGDKATPQSYIQKGSILRVQSNPRISKRIAPIERRPQFPTALNVRVLPGPEFEYFSNYTIGYFFSKSYKLTQESNRMGYRLDTMLRDFKPTKEVISAGIMPGTIQITSAGQPVILMRDAQTVGGYYRIANVITEDLNKLAQLKPGDKVAFSLIRVEELIQ